MARQFERQRDAERLLYVPCGWLCSLIYKITAPLGDTTLSKRLSEFDFCRCPASLRAALPKILKDSITGIALEPPASLRCHVADDSSRFFRGWLGFLSLTHVITLSALVQSLGIPAGEPALGRDYRRVRILMDRHQATSV